MLAADPLASIELMNEADTPDAVLAEFNERLFVVNEGGRAVIYCPRFDPILKRSYHDRWAFADLAKLYLNRTVLIGKDKRARQSRPRSRTGGYGIPLRRQFIHGVVFDPTGAQRSPECSICGKVSPSKPRPATWGPDCGIIS